MKNRALAEIVKKYRNRRGNRILEALDKMAQEYETAGAQVALAWLMAQPKATAPIASASNPEQLNQLIEATRIELNPSSLALLNEASA